MTRKPLSPTMVDLFVEGVGNMVEPGMVHAYGTRDQVKSLVSERIKLAQDFDRDPGLCMIPVMVYDIHGDEFYATPFDFPLSRLVGIGKERPVPEDPEQAEMLAEVEAGLNIGTPGEDDDG